MESKKSNAISVSVADQETREQNDDAFENEPRQPPGDSQKKTIAKIATTSISLRQKNRSNFGQQGTTMSAMSGVIRPILGKQPPQPLSQQPKPPQQAQQSQFKQQPQSQQPQSKPQSLSQSKSRSSSSAAASSSQSQPPSQQQQLQQKQPTPQQQQPQPPTLSSQPPSQQKMPVTTAQSKSVALYSGGSAGEWIGGTSQIVGNVSGNLNPRPKSKSCCKRQMELQTPTKSVTFSERNAGEDVGAGGPGGPVGSGPGGPGGGGPGGPGGGAGVVGVVVVVAGTGGGNQMEAKSKSTPTPIATPSASTGNSSSSSNNSNKIGQHSFKKSVRSMFSKKSTSSSSKATKQSSMGKTSEKLSFKSDGSGGGGGGGGGAIKKSLLQKLPKISKRIVNPIASTVGSKMFKRPDIERLEQDSMLRYVPPPKTSLKLKRLPQKSQQKPQQKFQKSQQKSQLKSQPKLQPNSQPSLNPKQQSQAPTSGSSGSGKAITDPNVTMTSTTKTAPTTKATPTIKTMTKSKVSSTAKTTKPTTPAANSYYLSIADKHMLGSSVTVGASNNIGGSKEFQNPDALFPDSGETNGKDDGSAKNCSYCGGCIGGSVGSGPINFCFCGRSVAFRNPNLDSSKAAQNQPHPPPPLLTPVSSSNPQSASLQTGNPPPPSPSPSPPPPPPPPPLLTPATVDGSGGSNAKTDPATPPTSPLIVIILAQNENMPPDSGTIQASTVTAPNSSGKAANPEMPGIGQAGLPESGQPQQQPQPPQAQQQEAPADLPPPPPPPPLNEVSVARWNVPASIHLDSNDMTFSNSRLPSEYPVPGNTSTMSLSANSVAVDLQQQQQQRWPLRTIDPFIKQQQQPQQQQQPKQQPQQQQQQQQQPFVFILAAKEQVPNTNDPQVGKNATLAASPSTESIDTGSSLASKSATNSKLDII